MIRIIKSDFYRVFRSIPVYIALILTILFSLFSLFIMQPGFIGTTIDTSGGPLSESTYDEVMKDIDLAQMQQMSIGDYRNTMKKVEGYELDRDITCANGNLYYFMIFFAALAISADFAGSIKNTLSSAISRKRYFVSKAVFVNLLCIGLLFLNNLLVYFGNLAMNGERFSSSFGKIMKVTAMQLPVVLYIASLLCFIAFLCKRLARFNMVAIPLMIIGQLLILIIGAVYKRGGKLVKFDIQSMFKQIGSNPSGSDLTRIFLFCGIAAVVCYLLGWAAFRKHEIK